MKTLLATVCFALSSGAAFAQSAPTDIPFAPAANSAWNVTEVRTRVARGEGQDQTNVATTRGTLAIGARTPDGFDAIWTMNRIEAAGVTITDEPQLLIGVDMRLSLDEVGTPVSVQDWPRFRQNIFSTVEAITPPAERTEGWRRSMTALQNLMAQWEASHAAQLLASSIAVMSICQGTGLRVGEPVSASTHLPNALGGPPIAATESLTLDSVDGAAGVARLTYSRALNPESATVAIREALVNLASQGGHSAEEIERMFDGMTLIHDTRAECVVDLATGVTRSVTHEIEVTMGPAYRSDRREITVSAR
ncbi:MAG TPA: hypothetical protein VEA80_02790 [Vitreimonas sp.]|uniref:hypothetical protein n=1 Tax=Vitreimonas sp. TaxID=3069702 RepID=UPI002D3425AF|nr:hypothetical protein [Vitreimonas sp.]HYD86379.1 hypothetical protein [Vitreimonas sp.]